MREAIRSEKIFKTIWLKVPTKKHQEEHYKQCQKKKNTQYIKKRKSFVCLKTVRRRGTKFQNK